jgi:Tol biopolymer transport system component
MGRTAAFVVCLTTAVLGLVVPASTVAAQETDVLAFTTDRDGNGEVYLLDLGTGAEENLTNNKADEGFLSWGPFGDRLVFASDRDGVDRFYVQSDEAPLPISEYENLEWSWSPDGNKIAWVQHQGFPDLWITDVLSGSSLNLTNGTVEVHGPTWSPDGRSILFVAEPAFDQRSDVLKVPAGGGAPVNLTMSPNTGDREARWSPNGGQIAYVSHDGQSAFLKVMDPNGSQQRTVVEFTSDACSSSITATAWSPDGSRLAYATVGACSPMSQRYEFFVVDAAGGDPQPLGISAGGGGLAWSPSGDRLAVTIAGPIWQRTGSLLLVDPDGQNPLNLTELVGSGMTYSPSWSPDGSRLAFVADPAESQPATPPPELATDIYLVDADGSHPIKLLAQAAHPGWKPAPRRGLGLVDATRGLWHLEGVTSFYFGVPGDVPVTGDWDGDGIETPGMFRPSSGFAYLRNSLDTGVADVSFFFGAPGDVPLAGDWDGDGLDSLGIYRPSIGKAFLRNTLDTGFADVEYYFGVPGDRPFVGDFDADGVDEIGLYRPGSGLTYLRLEHSTGIADAEFFFGMADDRVVAGDWNGDGLDTVGVFRPSDHRFHLRDSNSQGFADHVFWMGRSGWLPVAGMFGPITAQHSIGHL